jgi:hypothetical protein
MGATAGGLPSWLARLYTNCCPPPPPWKKPTLSASSIFPVRSSATALSARMVGWAGCFWTPAVASLRASWAGRRAGCVVVVGGQTEVGWGRVERCSAEHRLGSSAAAHTPMESAGCRTEGASALAPLPSCHLEVAAVKGIVDLAELALDRLAAPNHLDLEPPFSRAQREMGGRCFAALAAPARCTCNPCRLICASSAQLCFSTVAGCCERLQLLSCGSCTGDRSLLASVLADPAVTGFKTSSNSIVFLSQRSRFYGLFAGTRRPRPCSSPTVSSGGR